MNYFDNLIIGPVAGARLMDDCTFTELVICAQRVERNDKIVTFYEKHDQPLQTVECASINAAKRLVREFNYARR